MLINYQIHTFLSVKDAVNFMNDKLIPTDSVVSLTPSQFLNGVPSEWTLVINQPDELPSIVLQ